MRPIDADVLKDDISVYFADRYHLIDSIAERIDAAPTVESEIILCGECKWSVISDSELMCDNPKAWVVATDSAFGCVFGEGGADE